MTKTATKQAAKPADTPDFPAGKKQENMAEIMKVLRPAVQANPERFGLAQHAFLRHHFWAKSGSQLSDHTVPIFWLPLVSKMNPLDRIEITEETGAWVATLLVKSVFGEGVDVMTLTYSDIGGIGKIGSKDPVRGDLRIEYGGSYKRWCVCRGDLELISKIPSEREANEWAEIYQAPGSAG